MKDIKNKVVSKIKDTLAQAKEDQEQNLKLKDWQDRLSLARTGSNETIRDEREMIYLGTADVDLNVNTNARNSTGVRKKANNVVNLVLEFIETNVDSTIPQPSVRSKLPGFEKQAAMIEDSLTSDITELSITSINDINERITPVQGYSAMLVGWNPDFKHHLYRGELTIESVHPKRIIPQPGVWDLQRMDYFFVLSSVTKSFIKKRYGVDLENSGEQFPGLNTLDGVGSQSSNPDMVTEVVCWYKNDDGDVSKFVWCDDEVLEDLPNFFARRIDGKVEEFETLGSEVALADGEVLPVGTKVPYFTPTRYPLIIRENIPLNFDFGGQSDVDVIRDQQDAMKKVVSTIEEKIMRGGAIITALEGHRLSITGELYGVVKGTQAELAALNVKNLTADISQDLVFAQQQYKAAQSTLGITNSYQGKSDSTAVSGIAKQIQVNQASGRLRSKEANKFAAFKGLYETMFEFKLAFYDELRPFVNKDADGKDSYGDFDKYQFLVRDKAGELYYNTDFVFQSDAGAGLPRDKMWLFNQANEQLKYGAYNPTPASIAYWTQMVAQKYPNAKEVLDSINKQVEALSKKPDVVPKPTIAYKDLMPDAQSQLLEKLGIQSQGGQPLPQAGQEQPQPQLVEPQMQQEQPKPQGGASIPPEILQALERFPEPIRRLLLAMEPERLMVLMDNPNELMAAIEQMMQEMQGGGQVG